MTLRPSVGDLDLSDSIIELNVGAMMCHPHNLIICIAQGVRWTFYVAGDNKLVRSC